MGLVIVSICKNTRYSLVVWICREVLVTLLQFEPMLMTFLLQLCFCTIGAGKVLIFISSTYEFLRLLLLFMLSVMRCT